MSVVGVRVPISSRSTEGRDASILFCSFLAFAYADNVLRPMSPRCLQQSSTEKRPRLVAAVGCSSEQRRAAIPRLCVLQLRAFSWVFLVLLYIWFYNSDASELARRVSDQRMSERTGICRALASHASSRSLNCASRTRTLVYSTLDTHAACLRSPASLARDTHIAHVQRSLDLACLLPACTQSRD